MQDPYFIPFKSDISQYSLPEKFTFPFSYEPHPLTRLAAEELQEELKQRTYEKEITGKMYGLLLVKDSNQDIGYLAAYSGQQYEGEEPVNFVPSIFNRLEEDGFYKIGEAELVKLSEEIKALEQDEDFAIVRAELETQTQQMNLELKAAQEEKHRAKLDRKRQREEAEVEMSPQAYDSLQVKLGKESRAKDHAYKKFSAEWKNKIASVKTKTAAYESELERLKKERKQKSIRLQKRLFDQYRFLNAKGERKGVEKIFEPIGYPPSGAGDCALPKLLQYAFASTYEVLAMGEFWWGKAPESELRIAGRFYPACSGKCKPILGHMLEGLTLERDPLLDYSADDKVIETLYEDEWIAVIVKPAGLLSIPSKEIKDSVLTRMQQKYPQASGPLLAHRLDKLTSGILLISKDLESHKYLQQQFMNKTINKRYSAVLEGKLPEKDGTIDLPLAVDEDNRPMQKVSFESGRKALTEWEICSQKANRTLVKFVPVTGRTHQLRVHAAHPQGLNAPIVGDTLYGNKADRLMLHAEYIQFRHPHSDELLEFSNNADFDL